ncbi:MAG: dTDP-4-dehydrorhamnose 3,5-epimerase [Crocinitomicaceae bacterium]
MIVEDLTIEGLKVFIPKVFADDRGYFFESFNQKLFNEAVGESISFCQDNESKSSKFVLRGLHFQAPPFGQGKLVRVTQGSVLDIAVDLRKDSKTYGQYEKVLLSAENKKQFWIPEGFAHGFLALEDNTVFNYKCTGFYNKESEGGLNWDDPVLSIDWGLKSNPVLSEKDQVPTSFLDFNTPFQ